MVALSLPTLLFSGTVTVTACGLFQPPMLLSSFRSFLDVPNTSGDGATLTPPESLCVVTIGVIVTCSAGSLVSTTV